MIGVDTNILIYAHRAECPQHKKSFRYLKNLSEGTKPWVIAWPCLYEFLRVVTHPRVFSPPTPLATALSEIENLCASPTLILISETERHLPLLSDMALGSQVDGNLMFDTHIATLLLEHGVSEIATADNDFKRFKGLTIVNPVA
ncbi:MAG: PilT protein [uncultured bacterium]|nr:MAG: PilT protein [uncultured bacterium]